MTTDRFVYVTYIRATPEKLWDALRKPEFTREYWFGIRHESSWEQGASWKMIFPDGTVGDSGEVVEIDEPRRLVLKWRNEFRPELRAEGYSLCTFDIEADGDVTKLTVQRSPKSKFIEAVSGGWPEVLSNFLKSLLETGQVLSHQLRQSIQPEGKRGGWVMPPGAS
jgi:uncharacterized protein YndB with AHSA1/START domain